MALKVTCPCPLKHPIGASLQIGITEVASWQMSLHKTETAPLWQLVSLEIAPEWQLHYYSFLIMETVQTPVYHYEIMMVWLLYVEAQKQLG